MNALRPSVFSLTPEQEAIVTSVGDIKINAVAGSGKTTTVVEYARTRPPAARILYLAFNSAVRREAERKFQAQGLEHVQVETAHSLARRHIVVNSHYTVRKNGSFKPYELVDMLGGYSAPPARRLWASTCWPHTSVSFWPISATVTSSG